MHTHNRPESRHRHKPKDALLQRERGQFHLVILIHCPMKEHRLTTLAAW